MGVELGRHGDGRVVAGFPVATTTATSHNKRKVRRKINKFLLGKIYCLFKDVRGIKMQLKYLRTLLEGQVRLVLLERVKRTPS